MSAKFRIAVVALAVALAGAVANAADIVTYPALVCEKFCPHFASATPVEPFPPFFHAGAKVAGFVDVSFIVGVDGHTKDVLVERAVGPHALVDAALDTLKHVVYRPAVEDGVPVAESRRYRFEFSNDSASDDIAEKDCDAAAAPSPISGATMSELLMNAKCAAQWQTRAGDYVAALKASRIATIDEARWLAPDIREKALRLHVELEAQADEMGEAIMAFEALQKVDQAPLMAGDPDVAAMSRIYTAIDGEKPLTTTGVIAADGGDLLWQHVLFRRTFSFADVTGTIDRFAIRCGAQSFNAPYVENGAWNVPAYWGGCVLYVFGAAKTTFQLVESSAPAVARDSVHQ